MRKYVPTFSELIDRLSIIQLKEVFISEHKAEYAKEIADIVHDLDLIIKEHPDKIDGQMIRDIVVLAQMNLHIWHNESNFRKGIKEGNSLEKTHGINGIRNTAKNKIQEKVGGRKDYKIDCIAAEYQDFLPSGYAPAIEQTQTNPTPNETVIQCPFGHGPVEIGNMSCCMECGWDAYV